MRPTDYEGESPYEPFKRTAPLRHKGMRQTHEQKFLGTDSDGIVKGHDTIITN